MNGKEQTIAGTEIFAPRRDGKRVSVLYYCARTPGAPLLFDVHGGGFASGHHYMDDNMSALLRDRLDINVASVEYRYAPEVVYPVATQDSMDALEGLCADETLDFDRERIFLIGHSAGGNIVAGMSILAAGKRKLRGQILDYPFLDAKIDPRKRPQILFSIPPSVMKRFNDGYYPDRSTRGEALASPVYMDAAEAGRMPPTLVLTCSRDSLRDDGIRYAALLRENGARVEQIEIEGAVHGLTEMVASGGIDDCWWLGKRKIARQRELFTDAAGAICAFIERETV
ncbi:MAG TPA: alpha/beta hydrolase [Eubacteriales bacterium]|nr:alpha/beta hydrolase [Eubacteriales bacterium]